jgi:hypothetical protein
MSLALALLFVPYPFAHLFLTAIPRCAPCACAASHALAAPAEPLCARDLRDAVARLVHCDFAAVAEHDHVRIVPVLVITHDARDVVWWLRSLDIFTRVNE